ncbi:hypothetical protein Ahy_B10g103470 [Arachis hypogaea]|uniref:Transposase-associated domain-containing protein n=1 Tax=Arachis hypogaea TaxID=3818 RepID=A0A444X3Z1_ARAHY|nr:hypothetical protein Ahy_B10g103470 [Arachis hypogaea]
MAITTAHSKDSSTGEWRSGRSRKTPLDSGPAVKTAAHSGYISSGPLDLASLLGAKRSRSKGAKHAHPSFRNNTWRLPQETQLSSAPNEQAQIPDSSAEEPTQKPPFFRAFPCHPQFLKLILSPVELRSCHRDLSPVTDIDKSWITKPQDSVEYRDGLNRFLDFAFDNASSDGMIHCPYPLCGFRFFQTREAAYDHLLMKPFPSNYTFWLHHSERIVDERPSGREELDPTINLGEQMRDIIHDAFKFPGQ